MSFVKPSFASIAVLTLLATAVPAVSHAAPVTIYSTFGPGDSYGTSGYLASSVSFANTAFIPTVDSYLSSIDVAVEYLPDPLRWEGSVSLRQDNGSGRPGALLEHWTIFTLLSPDGIFSLPSVNHPFLASGTQYWLNVAGASGSGLAEWMFNSAGYEGLIYGLFHNPPELLVAPAYRVLGTEADPAGAPVPEPATWLLVGSGLVGTVRRRVRRTSS
jgi:hypothetical protein